MRWLPVLGLAVLLLAAAADAKEAQDRYPPGAAHQHLHLGKGQAATVHATPRLDVTVTADQDGADLDLNVTVKWNSSALPLPLPAAAGAISYIQVSGADAHVAQVAFDCAVDGGFRHDLLYWDGEGWMSLSNASGTVHGRSGGRDLRVDHASESGGHFVARVGHASSFALVSTGLADAAPPPSHRSPGFGLAALAVAAAVAAFLRRR